METLSTEWKFWITENLTNGVEPYDVLAILLQNGFDLSDVITSFPIFKTVEVCHKCKFFIPNAKRVRTSKAEIYQLEAFLNDEECSALISIIKSNLAPSRITTSSGYNPAIRNSNTCHLGILNNNIIKKIDDRICKLLGIPAYFSESLQGHYYDIGEEFKPHTDFFNSRDLKKYCDELGQRTFTVLVYLNNVEEGGETTFPLLGKSFQPTSGSALIWNNLNKDFQENGNTKHASLPIIKGKKFVLSKWFRSSSFTNGYPIIKEPNEYIKPYTETGFLKTYFPPKTFKKLQDFFVKNKHKLQAENLHKTILHSHHSEKSTSQLLHLPALLTEEVAKESKTLIEKWVGFPIKLSYVYGIRNYKRGSILEFHRDRLQTHKLGAILNVAQDVSKPWYLEIDDNVYRRHKVLLNPGEVLLYESGRLLHGRPTPLVGKYYANIFAHFVPDK